MIKIYKFAIWKHNRIIKMSDDKQVLVDYIEASHPIEKKRMWLAKRDGFGWVSVPAGEQR
ncbi:MAG: hypothetical protein PHQ00_05445 [Phycisphaerae bacterium]|nr:hypothetical protein [Phycisphaerae bacterium]